MRWFFLQEKERIVTDFRAIFDGGGEGDDFTDRWGWYEVIHALAGDSILKMGEVARLPIRQVFTHLAYLADREGKRARD